MTKPAARPRRFEAALDLHRSGRIAEALQAYDRAIALDGPSLALLNNRGIALTQLGRAEAAVESFDRALAIDPRHSDSLANRGLALGQLGAFADAVRSFDAALAVRADHPVARQYRPVAAQNLPLPEQAMAEARGLVAAGRLAEALDLYAIGLLREPDSALLHQASALVAWQLGDFGGTLAHCEHVLRRHANDAQVLNLRGLALRELGRPEEAQTSFEAAIRANPALPEPHNNLGETLQQLERLEDAIPHLERTLELGPQLPFVRGQLMHLRLRCADWRHYDADKRAIEAGIEAGRPEIAAFPMLAVSDDPALQRRAAEISIRRTLPEAAAALPAQPKRDRLRIGYFSADFFAHATMYLIADAIEAHDPTRFETFAFSYGSDSKDAWRSRAEAMVGRFIDVRDRTPAEVAALGRELRLDVAVDLKGLTGHHRLAIFGHRAAPVQITWLGYPGTVPYPAIDYAIVDPVVVPARERAHFAERLIVLPGSYQPNCLVSDDAMPPAPDRVALGLPESGFVFACFSQTYKITPHVFGLWMEILRAVPASVLWHWTNQPSARDNLRREAEARGVSGDRLILAGIAPREAHLARLQRADLLLDTWPCGAHTTASDALRAGLPVLTRPGRSFASRVAASLLTEMDEPDLIATGDADYVGRAVALAQEPEQLAKARERLSDKRFSAPLFQPEQFARQLESAYAVAVERLRSGAPAGDIIL